MSKEVHIDDETLMAYVDGELDAAQAAQVVAAMQHDATLTARIAQHRALRVRLQSDLAAILSEPIPKRLLTSLQSVPAYANDKVIDLAQVRQRKEPVTKRSWNSREWSAMAASLIAGIVLGVYALNFNSTELVSTDKSGLLAQGKLANALTTQLASTADDSAKAIQIGISFRNHAGEYCRSFTVRDGSSVAGLACRAQSNWRVQMLTETNAGAAGEFRQAASDTPATILTLIDQQIAGDPLDAAAEATAQRAGWQ